MTSSPVTTGDVINERYVLYEELWRTPYSVVFEARKVEPPRNWVRLELLLPLGPRVSQSSLMRLSSLNQSPAERTEEALERLAHPHIVRILEHGVLPTGHVFTVRAPLEGVTLRQHLQRVGPIPEADALHLMRRVLDTLGAAHSADLIHRRLTPDTLFVMDSIVDRGCRILDFGLSDILHSNFPGLDDRDRWLPILGPPEYLAPELLSTEAGEPAPQSDLYAFGLILAECITGKPVIPHPDPQTIVDIQRAHTPLNLPTALRDRPIGAVLQKLLAKRAADRYRRAEDVSEALDHLDRSDVTDILESGTLPIAGDLPSNEPSYFTAPPTPDERNSKIFLGVGLALVVGAILLVLLSSEPEPPPADAQAAEGTSNITDDASAPESADVTTQHDTLEPELAAEAEPPVRGPAPSEVIPTEEPPPPTFSIITPRKELEQLCDKGEQEACLTLGKRLQALKGWANHHKGAKLFKAGCDDHRHIGSCIALAHAMVVGRGIEREPDEAYDLLKGLCELEDRIEACFEQAVYTENGRGTGASRSEAEAIYRRLCDEKKLPRGCVEIGRLRERQKDLDSDQYLEIGAIYERACNAGDGEGCLRLGKLYRDGHGYAPNNDRWVALVQQGCDILYGPACTYLGDELKEGSVLENDARLALDTYDKACELNDPEGCARVCGMRLFDSEVKGHPELAYQACEKGCLLADPKACRRAALMVRDGQGTESNYSRHILYLRKACKGREKKACARLKKLGKLKDDDEEEEDP